MTLNEEEKFINGIRMKVGSEEYMGLSIKEAFAIAVQTMMPHLKYMSKTGVAYFINDIKEMMKENMGLRIPPSINNFLVNLEKSKSKDVVQPVWDLLLTLEDLGINKKGYGS